MSVRPAVRMARQISVERRRTALADLQNTLWLVLLEQCGERLLRRAGVGNHAKNPRQEAQD